MCGLACRLKVKMKAFDSAPAWLPAGVDHVGHFFFQAEDGIRDGRVTGVQTCALPISHKWRDRRMVIGWRPMAVGRSEERRVGKSVDLGGSRIIKKKSIITSAARA